MSETPRRYSAEEIRLAQADVLEACKRFSHLLLQQPCACPVWAHILEQAAEHASRLEQIEHWVSVQMSEGELRGYLPDLRKFLSSSAGRREDT